MFDFDPRDYDSCDHERYGNTSDRGSAGSDDRDRDDNSRQPEIQSRERQDSARTLGRGPGSDRQNADKQTRNPQDDARSPERERDGRERAFDPRDVFTRHLHLPAAWSANSFAIATG
jgi:hypothetical protein